MKYAIMIMMVLVLGTGCQRHESVPGKEGEAAEVPDQEIWDSEVILTTAGRKTAVLAAKHIAKYEKTNEVLVDGVKVDFFDREGEHTSVLTSKHGQVNEKTSDLEATDSVVVRSDEGVTLETEKLFWDNAREKIHSDQFVRITTSLDTVTGVGFESDPDLRHWEIKSGIQGAFKRDVKID